MLIFTTVFNWCFGFTIHRMEKQWVFSPVGLRSQERSHKVDPNQHRSVDPEKFQVGANGWKKYNNQEISSQKKNLGAMSPGRVSWVGAPSQQIFDAESREAPDDCIYFPSDFPRISMTSGGFMIRVWKIWYPLVPPKCTGSVHVPHGHVVDRLHFQRDPILSGLLGKIYTGNHGFDHQSEGFPVLKNNPIIQVREYTPFCRYVPFSDPDGF